MLNFDLLVLGAGPGGYVAAIKAAQKGLSVGLIEKDHMGGICLNVGCIPSKTFFYSTQISQFIKKAASYGITTKEHSLDFAFMQKRKDDIVNRLSKSLEGLVKAHGVKIIKGSGKFIGPHEILVEHGLEQAIYKSKKTIIATGSRPQPLSLASIDGKRIHDSTSIQNISKLPKNLLIIGGGVIGCEFASFFADLGVEVTIIEACSYLLPNESGEVAKALETSFKRKGIQVATGSKVEKMDPLPEGMRITYNQNSVLNAEAVLIAVGRRPNTDQLNLDKIGLKLDEKGIIPVNEYMETSVAGVYAIGDVAGRWQLAHVASHQAAVAAANACGEKLVMKYHAIPSVVFTSLEIATVGLKPEQAAKESHIIAHYPFQALGKSIAIGEVEGFARLIVEKSSQKIVGAEVVGKEAALLISEMVLAVQCHLTLPDLLETVHPHPTLSEIWLELANIASGTPLHSYPQPHAR